MHFYIRIMRVMLAGLLLGLLAGCQADGLGPAPVPEAEMFAPMAMRIHPIFTRVRDWTGDGRNDGVEALIEFQDPFGDPTKARGRVIFELFEYRSGWPDPRGNRLGNPWIGALMNFEEQRERWNRTSRTYTFQLAHPAIRSDRHYVLTAVFELAEGGRFFDRMVIEAQRPGPAPPQERPAPSLQEPARVEPATTPSVTQPVEP